MAEIFSVVIREIDWHMATYARDMRRALDDAVRTGADILLTEVQAAEPYVTGFMFNSTIVRPLGELHYPVVIQAEYATLVNEETASSVPLYFAERAAAAAAPEAEAHILKILAIYGVTP